MALQATYELVLKNHARQIIARFPGIGRGFDGGGLRSFSYQKRLRTPGGSNVNIYGNDSRLQYLTPIDNHLDYQWEVYRNDPLDESRGFYRDHEWFHRGEESTSDEDGQLVYRSYGQDYNVFVVSETIDFPTGSPQSRKSGDVTTNALAYVNENIGPGAGVDSQGFSRVRPNFQIATAALAGVTYEKDFAGELLYDVLKELADFARFEFMVESENNQFVFNWRKRPFGKDRREGNSLGNVPVIFESQRANITNTTQAKTFMDAITSVAVRGSGIEDLRILRNVNDAAALALSPWARRCVSRNANREHNTAVLDNIGLAILNESESKTRSSFTYRQTETLRYGRDWDVGDFATHINDFGQSKDVVIVGATVSFSEGVETIIPELEELIE